MKKIPIVAVLALSVLASCTILQPMRDGCVQHARAPVHAQDQRTKAETLATLERMCADVDWKTNVDLERAQLIQSTLAAPSTQPGKSDAK